MRRLKVLMLTRLFPSKAFPTLGTFCLERAKALAKHADVRVLVPTPWFPHWIPGPASWRKWSSVEDSSELEGGITATYPRYLSVPKISTWPQGIAMAHAVQKHYAATYDGWIPDIVDGHFAFPDGFAAVKLAKHLKCPSMVTCHGSDLRVYPDLPVTGKMLNWVLASANRVISVSTSLRNKSIKLGCPEKNTFFLPNGVDPAKFKLREKVECRKRLDLPLEGKIGVCVAALIDVKNQSLIIQALDELRRRGQPLPFVVFIGEGANRNRLEQEVHARGLQSQFLFAGQRPHAEIALWMGAADWLLLSSLSEGWATVYFEAMSCGRPVLSTNVSSASDAISRQDYGIVVDSFHPAAFADAMIEMGGRYFDEKMIRNYAEAHSWAHWAEQAIELINITVGPRHA